jgi:hypothetical protein
MGFEGEGHRRSADLAGPLDDLPEDGLMTEVHAVEVSEGEHRVGELFAAALDAPDDAHVGPYSHMRPGLSTVERRLGEIAARTAGTCRAPAEEQAIGQQWPREYRSRRAAAPSLPENLLTIKQALCYKVWSFSGIIFPQGFQ